MTDFAHEEIINLGGILYKLEIKGEAEITPSAERQTIINAIIEWSNSQTIRHFGEDVAFDMSIFIINALREKFDLVPRE